MRIKKHDKSVPIVKYYTILDRYKLEREGVLTVNEYLLKQRYWLERADTPVVSKTGKRRLL